MSTPSALHSVTDPKTLELIENKRKLAGSNVVFLARNSNQALGIGKYAIDFINQNIGSGPDKSVIERTEQFHTDSVVCGLSALALNTNAPRVLREEALDYNSSHGAKVFGSKKKSYPEKAILANCSAVREWDSNGTVFGYNSKLGHNAGEFGHNDFYPVAIAACQLKGLDGNKAILAMIAIDEIRGRLAEVFSLKTYHIDHVVHGAIASAAVYGALMGATEKQIEYAIGMVVAHYIPFRAIRAGEQLSDSKGASAAISTEVAILAIQRAMRGFIGPADIFRNPEAIFRKFQPTQKAIEGDSPFDIVLTHSGTEFAVMGMHFKLGLYEHQSAGALQGLINLLAQNPNLLSPNTIKSITVVAYQPAFGIIGDPAKRNPTTRQSADHSMVYILSRLLQKAVQIGSSKLQGKNQNEFWQELMLLPIDYSRTAINDPTTRQYMNLIDFKHGGPEYDSRYPEGIPTSIIITDSEGKSYDSGLIMFPAGHAANTEHDLQSILKTKFARLASLAVGEDKADALLLKLAGLKDKTPKEIDQLYEADIQFLSSSSSSNTAGSGMKRSASKAKKRVREESKDDENNKQVNDGDVQMNEY